MFGWAITFLLIALVAAVLGFGGIATFAVDIAKIIFFVALILFLISTWDRALRRRRRRSERRGWRGPARSRWGRRCSGDERAGCARD